MEATQLALVDYRPTVSAALSMSTPMDLRLHPSLARYLPKDIHHESSVRRIKRQTRAY